MVFINILFYLLVNLFFGYSQDIGEGYLKAKFITQNSKRIQYVSGTMHYFRVHPSEWRDRLKKLRWAGLHAVQTYIEWSSHEPEHGVYDFTNGLDIGKFIQIAQEEGLLVILRPGPYICAERDLGGLPYWLLQLEPSVRMRSSDPKFMKYVKEWFEVLLPILKPYLRENGGPIAMVQVENEYGNSHECDFQYLTDLANMLKDGLGANTTLFSTDNGRTAALKCAKIPGVYATVDFGPEANYTQEFQAQRLFEPVGPLVCSEFYTGWLDYWGAPHNTKSSEVLCSTFEKILEDGGSVNFYVFHGGTSFGFGSGATGGDRYRANPTNYDYDAPLSEAGDPTDKYFAIRNVIEKFFKVPSGIPPKPVNKYSYGKVHLAPVTSAFDVIESPTSSSIHSELPLTFEAIGESNGLVAYQNVIEKSMSDPAILRLEEVHDRAYVYIEDKFQGIASREQELYEVPIFGFPNQTLTIFVESQGRVVGPNLNDFKGLTNTPMINGNKLMQWTMIPFNLSKPNLLMKTLSRVRKEHLMNFYTTKTKPSIMTPKHSGMVFYEGVLRIPKKENHPMTTFVRLDNWRKGYIWINGFLLGRYWPVMGPQLTLYVPPGILKQGLNNILVFELEGLTTSLENKDKFIITFVDQPVVNGTTPK